MRIAAFGVFALLLPVIAGCAARAPSPAIARAPDLRPPAAVTATPSVVVTPTEDEELNPGEAFVAACGTTDFDDCAPLTDERVPLWRRAIMKNLDELDTAPSTKIGLVAGVRAATGFSILGEPARAAAILRRVYDAYASDLALAPYEAGAARGVSSELAEYQARVDVIAPLLEHAARADLAALDLASAEDDYERIARSPRLKVSERGAALALAMKLACSVGARERIASLQTLAHALALPPGARAEIDWLAATIDYTGWDAAAADEGDNRQKRIASLPAIQQFYVRYREVVAAAPYLVEAAWAVSEMKRVAGDADQRAWTKRVGDAWAVVVATTTERDPSVVDHAARASVALLEDDIAKDFGGWPATCARSNPATLFAQPDPDAGEVTSKGTFDDKLALAAQYEKRIDRVSLAFYGSPSLSGFHATDGRLFDDLRACLVAAQEQLRAQASSPVWIHYTIERELDGTVRRATREYTLAIVHGVMDSAAVRSQARLASFAMWFGNLSIEATIRDSLGSGEFALRFADELPGPGAIYVRRGAGWAVAPDLVPPSAPEN